jgi:hypothetical protein
MRPNAVNSLLVFIAEFLAFAKNCHSENEGATCVWRYLSEAQKRETTDKTHKWRLIRKKKSPHKAGI